MKYPAVIVWVLVVLSSTPLVAQTAPNPSFPLPTGKVVGWRGDGTGCYPQATPPMEWGRNSKNMIGVTAQALKPGTEASGQAIADGAIHQWLVLGPVPAPAGAKIAAEFLPGEAQFSPDENQKVGELTWKLVKTDSSYLDFNAALAKSKDSAAFAHTYLYSPTGLPLILREMHHGKIMCWLNGAPVFNSDSAWSNQVELKVKKGWNSLLLKVQANAEGWYTCYRSTVGRPGNATARTSPGPEPASSPY